MGIWKRAVESILDLFLKPNCPLCQRPGGDDYFCRYCIRQLKDCQFTKPVQRWSGPLPVFVWGSYGGPMKRAIAAMKYEDRPQLARPLGRWLAQAWLDSPTITPNQKILAVPIPMHPEKQKKRGFNQAELIARSFCEFTGYPLSTTLLQRSRATEALFNLSPEQRKQELDGAITLGKAAHRLPKTPVLLIDDIYTTGATCREAAKVLHQAGITVFGIAAIATTKPDPEPPSRPKKHP